MRTNLDDLFRLAVDAVDRGDVAELDRLLAEHPELAGARLEQPGEWLRAQVGGALDDFFRAPYLLWFVAEDPVRNDRLPANIAEVAARIIAAVRRTGAPSLKEQVDHALRLVSWSWVARRAGVQIALIDVLLDAGADPDRNPENALINGNFEAAEHLLARGAKLTFATALCLGRWADVDRLAPRASATERQFAFVLAALKGKPEALRRALALGVDLDQPSTNLYSHGTPLHHAVSSGCLEAVQVLVRAGAQREVKDTAWQATPLGWAEYYLSLERGEAREYAAIADYLRGLNP